MARPAPGSSRRTRRPAFYALGRRARRRRGDAAAPAVHALASQLLRARRRARAARLRRPRCCGAWPPSRSRWASRRTRSTSSTTGRCGTALQRPRAAGRGGRSACSARSRSASAGILTVSAVAGAARARSAGCSCPPTTSSSPAGASTATSGSRSAGARSRPSPATSSTRCASTLPGLLIAAACMAMSVAQRRLSSRRRASCAGAPRRVTGVRERSRRRRSEPLSRRRACWRRSTARSRRCRWRWC